MYTDDLKSYIGVQKSYQTVNHTAREFVRDMAHTNSIESFWSMMKRAYDGTYHKISHKHLQRYVDEFTGRHNIRKMNTEAQMALVSAAMAGNGLPSGAHGGMTLREYFEQ